MVNVLMRQNDGPKWFQLATLGGIPLVDAWGKVKKLKLITIV